MAFTCCYSAFADGFGDSFFSEDDDLLEFKTYNYDPEYTVAYNNFENVTAYSNGNFPIINTGDESYGKALSVPAKQYVAIDLKENNVNGKYMFEDTDINMFNEPLTIGEKYVLQYDYKSFDFVGEKFDFPFSFALKHNNFSNAGGTDWMDYQTKYYDDKAWHTRKLEFEASSSSALVKLNTVKAQVNSYIDNYIITKAASISVSDKSGTVTLNDLSGSIVKGLINGDYYACGMPAKFSVNTGNVFTVSSVTMGGNPITPDSDGIYNIEKVTGDIEVNANLTTENFEEKYYAENGEVYLPLNTTAYKIADNMEISEKLLTNSQANSKFDTVIKPDSVLTLGTETDKKDYTAKLLGDYNDDNTISVTDVVESINCILDKSQFPKSIGKLDMNIDGSITVTDIERTIDTILNCNIGELSADSDILSKMQSYIDNTITASGYAVTDTDLTNSVYNDGNRTRVANVIKKAMRGEDITLCCFGGSITQGGVSNAQPISNITHTITTPKNYCKTVEDWWRDMFSGYGCNVTMINEGIGATDSVLAAHRAQQDVLSQSPDLVIVEWDVNDGSQYLYKQATYESMVNTFLESDTALVMMGFSTNSINGTSQSLHEPISDLYKIPYISYPDAFGSNPNYAYLSTDGTHPNIVGHSLAGMILNRYFMTVYNDIANIGNYDSKMPDTVVNEESKYYNGAFMANLSDIADGKYQGVSIESTGSFVREATGIKYGSRDYIGYTARYAESYEPMVIRIEKCKTLFIQMMRSRKFGDAKYEVEVNGVRNNDTSLTSSAGGAADNSQPETGYFWASIRLCFYESGKDTILKIYPTNSTEGEYVQLFSLLLSQAK